MVGLLLYWNYWVAHISLICRFVYHWVIVSGYDPNITRYDLLWLSTCLYCGSTGCKRRNLAVPTADTFNSWARRPSLDVLWIANLDDPWSRKIRLQIIRSWLEISNKCDIIWEKRILCDINISIYIYNIIFIVINLLATHPEHRF